VVGESRLCGLFGESVAGGSVKCVGYRHHTDWGCVGRVCRGVCWGAKGGDAIASGGGFVMSVLGLVRHMVGGRGGCLWLFAPISKPHPTQNKTLPTTSNKENP